MAGVENCGSQLSAPGLFSFVCMEPCRRPPTPHPTLVWRDVRWPWCLCSHVFPSLCPRLQVCRRKRDQWRTRTQNCFIMNFVMKAALGGEWPTGLEVGLIALQCKGLKRLCSCRSSSVTVAALSFLYLRYPWRLQILKALVFATGLLRVIKCWDCSSRDVTATAVAAAAAAAAAGVLLY